MTQPIRRLVAAADILLVLPASLFMAALFLRSAFPPAEPAQRLVHWYEVRLWTLWVLLFGLPCLAFLAGVATLMSAESRAVLRAHMATFLVAATTVAAAGILAIVVLHMAAN